MIEYIGLANLIMSILILPVLGYIILLERRLTIIETIIKMCHETHFKKGGDEE